MNVAASLTSSCVLTLLLASCGGTSSDEGGINLVPDGGVCSAVSDTELNCSDGVDDNCDGKVDCENTECAFDPACTGVGASSDECGSASYGGNALAIPDGVGQSYETSVTINGFDDGQILQNATGFVSACVTMEHSWLRDLQIEMICPSGEVVILQEFLGTEGSELFMGQPNDNDGVSPTPGIGEEYCWTAAAANAPMLQWANSNPAAGVLPAGDYRPVTPFAHLIGCSLNGDWTIRATDDWASDNGYIFEWSVNFSTDIISDCSDWID